MTYQFRRADPASVSELYSALFGRKVAVRKGVRMSTGPRDIFTAAVYKTEHGDMVGMAAFDLALSSSMGAALSLIPPHAAKKIEQTGEFDEMTWDNLLEVYNVTTRFFHDAFSGVMIALEQVYTNPKDLPPDLLKYLRRSAHRYDMGCEVHGYGKGSMTFVSN